jgi:hypothetical protein
MTVATPPTSFDSRFPALAFSCAISNCAFFRQIVLTLVANFGNTVDASRMLPSDAAFGVACFGAVAWRTDCGGLRARLLHVP